MSGELEYFLIRTLPSKKKPLSRMFGNKATPGMKQKVAGIQLELVEREAEAFKGIFEGTMEYSPSLKSHLLSLITIKGCDRKIDGVYGIASLRGSMQKQKYMATRIVDRKVTCLANYKPNGHNYMRSAFSYKNIVGICTHEHFLIYDAPRMDKGAMIGIRGCFGASFVYEKEVWIMLQLKRNYNDSDIACLDYKKIQSFLESTPEVPQDVFTCKIANIQEICRSVIPILKPTTNETSGLVVDHNQVYLAYRSELLVFNKRTCTFQKRIKYPKSNLDGVSGRGTKVLYVSTHNEVAAYSTPEMVIISSVDTYNKKERKIVSVKLVRGVELVFAVGHNTGGVSIFCLVGRKMVRVFRSNDLIDNPIEPGQSHVFPSLCAEESGRNVYLYGFFKPIRFSMKWT